jgi:hypothetical protein
LPNHSIEQNQPPRRGLIFSVWHFGALEPGGAVYRNGAEGEEKMSGYLKQKLFQALHDLVGAGDMDKRLTHAGNYLAHLQEADIPKEHRVELAAIKEIMFTTPLSSEQGYVPRQISDEDGSKLARRILSLFTDVMGGL